jgi:hypothetical protein
MYRFWIIILLFSFCLINTLPSQAENPFPQAPATLSWLPHGYGQTMHVLNTPVSWQKGLHGFRSSPEHIGSWSHPLWGWDVNGYYRGPQVPDPDPGAFQLPIGLIYPANNERLQLEARSKRSRAPMHP